MESYLESIKKQFEYYKSLGDKTFEQIPEDKLFWKMSEESNRSRNSKHQQAAYLYE